MFTSASPGVKDKELMSLGLVESAGVNSFSDFSTLNSRGKEAKVENEKNYFIDIFICHLIFYTVFCISLVLHILFDLGLGSLIKNQFLHLIEIAKNTFVRQEPAFALSKEY